MAKSTRPTRKLDFAEAAALLDSVDVAPTIVNIARAAGDLAEHDPSLVQARARLACLASFTFEPLVSAMTLQGLRARLGIEPYVAPFGQFDRELIDATSGLSAFNPDAVLLAIRLQDVCPALYESFNSLAPADAARLVEDWIGRLRSAVSTFRSRCPAAILIQNYNQPETPALGIADRLSPASQCELVSRVNADLAKLAESVENVRVMDYDGLVARHGRRSWEDRRMALYARIPVAPANYWRLAGFYVRHLRPLFGLSKKVLVLDADNTLWGGVVGDVGLDGIALGQDYPGSAFVALQRRALDLYHRGVILCLASKNEPGSVEEVLQKHPAMVLRMEHFAAMRINWAPKPQNVEEMAAELNLGVDSFVFIDDSPVECDLMRKALPQVATVLLPKEPAEYAAALESLDCFDQWQVSSEDRQRGGLYRAEAKRRELQSSTVDMPTFYRQLQMKVVFSVNQPAHVARAAQMTNRTNQFNMHTIRCSEDDIRGFMDGADADVITLALADRFGDNGIVGLAVVKRSPEEWLLHLFLMSCRVLGRTVEQSFVRWIAGRAAAAKARRLVGCFALTPKNKPFAGFYESCGFVPDSCEGKIQRWTRPLHSADTSLPDWIEMRVDDRAEKA